MKILILGTGNAQIDAIQYLKKNGHYVYAISYKDEKTGSNLVDHFEIIDIRNKQKALEFVACHKIELVYSIGSDIAMPTIGFISRMLSLPCFVDEHTAELMLNKSKFRNFLKLNNFCNIKYTIASKIDDLNTWAHFPAIIKPVDSQGQRGIFEIKNKLELKLFFQKSLSFSLSKKIIVEEFIQGTEISVNSYVHNGKILYHFISKRESVKNYPGGIAKSHIFPANLSTVFEKKIIDLIEQVITKLKISNGPVYWQIKISNTDDIYIIEGTPRLDGCHIWRLIKSAYKIDLLDLTFKHLLQIPQTFSRKSLLSKKKSFKLEFFLKKPGKTFHSQEYVKPSLKNYLKFYYKDGDTIGSINGHMEKTGYFISSND